MLYGKCICCSQSGTPNFQYFLGSVDPSGSVPSSAFFSIFIHLRIRPFISGVTSCPAGPARSAGLLLLLFFIKTIFIHAYPFNNS
jgi:hypothetical protein